MATIKKLWREPSGLQRATIDMGHGIEIEMIQYFEAPVTTDADYDVFADLGLSEKDTEQDDEVLEIIGRIS